MKLKLKNVSAVKLGGKLPGQVFSVAVGDDGKPIDTYWAARLDEEAKFNVGAIIVIPDTVAVVAPEPARNPAAEVAPSSVPDAVTPPADGSVKKGKA